MKIKLVKKIKNNFPNLNWQQAVLVEKGWEHWVIILDNKLVFRFPKDKNMQSLLANEIKLLKFLQTKVDLKIPKYKYIAKNYEFAGYDIISGFSFTPYIWQRKIEIKNKIKIAKQLAIFISSLHSISIEKLKKDFKVKNFSFKRLQSKYIKNYKKYLFSKLNKKERKLIEKHFQELENIDQNKYQKVFVHGDLWKENIIINKNYKKINGIIDFSDRAIFDPAIDFTYFWVYGSKFIKLVYNQYKGKKDVDFLKRSYIYYQRDVVDSMICSFQNFPVNFKNSYKEFKKRFKI